MPAKTPHVNGPAEERAKPRSSPDAAKPAAAELQQGPLLSESLQRAFAEPGRLAPNDVLALQRAAGNRAVNRLLDTAAAKPGIQRCRAVGAAHDPYEQEADRSAEQVMAMAPDTPAVAGSGGKDGLARAGEAALRDWRPAGGLARRKPIIQRTYLDVADPVAAWKKHTSSFFSSHRGKGSSGGKLQEIDGLLADFARAKTELARRRALAQLKTLLHTWLAAYEGHRRAVGQALLAEVNARLGPQTAIAKALTTGGVDTVEGWKAKIKDDYGIDLDQQAGIDAIKKSYTETPQSELAKLKAKDWDVDELKSIYEALGKYRRLLGAERPAEQGSQPLRGMSRLEYAVDSNGKQVETDATVAKTAGESFAASKHVIMFDTAAADTEFAKNKKHPTKEELMTAFRGTAEHELSHALIEPLILANGQKAIDKFAKDMKFWKTRYYSAYWRNDANEATNRGGYSCNETHTGMAAWSEPKGKVEPPVNRYAMTNSSEDLAESMRYYFENQARLGLDAPERLQWIKDNIIAHLEPPKPKAVPKATGGTGGKG